MTKVAACAVVGGGTMGRGIAHLMAAAGIDVTLVERDAHAAELARVGIEEQLDFELAKWGITPSERKAILSRIAVTDDLGRVQGVGVVLEAINEDLPGKQALWGRVEALAAPGALAITHTAALSISEIARTLRAPDRMIGMHFLPPAQRVKLVEIVRGLKTSQATYEEARALAIDLGKTPVEVNESPGYLTARLIVPLLNEAMQALMEGVASAQDIDTAMKLGFGLEVGPLALADRIGLDQVMRWMMTLFSELGLPQFRPCPLLRKLVRAGHLGVKSGRGFHVYEETHPARTS